MDYKDKVIKLLMSKELTKEQKSKLLDIFPELMESDDERIRKELLGYCKNRAEKYPNDPKYKNISAWIAWIEKQGKHANFINKIQIGDKVTRNRDGALVNLSQLNRVAKKDEKQGEQPQGKSALEAAKEEKVDNQNCVKPADKVESKFKVGDTITDPTDSTFTFHINAIKDGKYIESDKDWVLIKEADSDYELVEQKSADADLKDIVDKEANAIWKEINTGGSHSIIDSFNQFYGICMQVAEAVMDYQRPAWSEEDKRIMKALIDYFMWNTDSQLLNEFTNREVFAWLKSLRPQSQWKPSDGQLECLGYAIEKAEIDWSPLTNNRIYLTLKILKEQLEKLREE